MTPFPYPLSGDPLRCCAAWAGGDANRKLGRPGIALPQRLARERLVAIFGPPSIVPQPQFETIQSCCGRKLVHGGFDHEAAGCFSGGTHGRRRIDVQLWVKIYLARPTICRILSAMERKPRTLLEAV